MNPNELKENLMNFDILDIIEIFMKNGERIYIRKYEDFFTILGSNIFDSKIGNLTIKDITMENLIKICMESNPKFVKRYYKNISGR